MNVGVIRVRNGGISVIKICRRTRKVCPSRLQVGSRWRWEFFLGRSLRKNIGVGTRKVGVVVGLELVRGVGVGVVRARKGVTGGPMAGGMSVFVGGERGVFLGGWRVLGGGRTRLPLTFKGPIRHSS